MNQMNSPGGFASPNKYAPLPNVQQNFSWRIPILVFSICVAIVSLVTVVDLSHFVDSFSCQEKDVPVVEEKAIGKEEDIRKPFMSFNSTNPNSNWCPYAICHNSPTCGPCNRRYLLLLATARSGSTTLLKMFNFLPNVRISGENSNEIYLASKLVSNFKGENSVPLLDQNFDRTEGAYFHNAIPPQSMSCPIQSIINTLNPAPQHIQQMVNVTGNPSLEEYDTDRILGVKTIRFQKGDWSVQEASNFLREYFPCSRVVANIRSDVESQLKSMSNTFKNDHKGADDTDKILKMNDFLIRVAEELGSDMAKLIDMNDWTQNVDVLNEVVQWLGYRECKYAGIVHENAAGYDRDHETEHDMGKNCHYVGN